LIVSFAVVVVLGVVAAVGYLIDGSVPEDSDEISRPQYTRP
jgi:hypothetical protein